MPTKYNRKTLPPNREKIGLCLEKVKSGEMSLHSASLKFDIPKSTVWRYLQCNFNNSVRAPPGIRPNLPGQLTAEIAGVAREAAENGFGLSKKELGIFVSHVITKRLDCRDETGEYLRKNCRFKNSVPGDEWVEKFMRDYQLSLVKPSPLERSRYRSAADPEVIYGFYDLIKKEMERLDILDKPSHIFNTDETSFCVDPSRGKVVAATGIRRPQRITAGAGRLSISVMACVSADGKVQPPLVIFPGKYLHSTWHGHSAVPGTTYAKSESGWMTAEIFNSWFINFCNQVKQRPLLLLFDGHKTHLSLDFIHLARNANVSVIKLPSHTTNHLQPLDSSCFRPLKLAWDERLVQHQRENGFTALSKRQFVDLLSDVWPKALKTSTVQSGFRETGIFPLNAHAFPRKLFSPAMLKVYENKFETILEPIETSKPSTSGPLVIPNPLKETIGTLINRLKELTDIAQENSPPESGNSSTSVREVYLF
jgi:hypothetical protein